MRTLCVDIGGTGIKAMVLDAHGKPTREMQRVATPQPATPDAVIDSIVALAKPMGSFDRVSVGYPGVVVAGVTQTGHNLGSGWQGFPLGPTLQGRLGNKPVRVANDAGVQGLGVIEGKGTEVVLTFGTGMGFGLFIEGIYVPNIEMAHHPFKRKKTYEERVGDHARKKLGAERWSVRVHEVVDQLRPILNWRKVYLGGGNSRHLDPATFGPDVAIVDNAAGITGGWKLWADQPAPTAKKSKTKTVATT